MAKVLIITRWYPTRENPVHGVFVKEFAKASALHNDVIVLFGELTERTPTQWPYEIIDTVEDRIRTIRFIYRRGLLKSHRLINLIGFTHCLIKLKKEYFMPDIIHLHVYLACLPAIVFSRLYRIPLVITEHYTGFVRNILSFYERLAAHIIFKQADVILPVSHHLEKYLHPYAPMVHYEVIPNVVDTSIFRVSPFIPKDRSEIKKIVFVGRLDPAKGVEYLLNALNLLKNKRTDFFLDIIGDGTQKKFLEQMAIDMDLSRFVCFHGIITKNEVAKIMAKCDFFVLPSLFETFGCVIIEAMACGKPVVASNIGGPNEIVTSQTGILVQPGDAEVLKDAINYMLDNYASYSANKIANYAAKRFSLPAIGCKLNNIYQDLMTVR
jgi:L-malate glycosyltransferase